MGRLQDVQEILESQAPLDEMDLDVAIEVARATAPSVLLTTNLASFQGPALARVARHGVSSESAQAAAGLTSSSVISSLAKELVWELVQLYTTADCTDRIYILGNTSRGNGETSTLTIPEHCQE